MAYGFNNQKGKEQMDQMIIVTTVQGVRWQASDGSQNTIPSQASKAFRSEQTVESLAEPGYKVIDAKVFGPPQGGIYSYMAVEQGTRVAEEYGKIITNFLNTAQQEVTIQYSAVTLLQVKIS